MIVWWRRTPSNVAPMPRSAPRDRSLRAWVLNSTRSASSVSKACAQLEELGLAVRAGPLEGRAEPGPADLQPSVLGRDGHEPACCRSRGRARGRPSRRAPPCRPPRRPASCRTRREAAGSSIGWLVIQRKTAGSWATRTRSSRWRSASGSSRTREPSSVTGVTQAGRRRHGSDGSGPTGGRRRPRLHPCPISRSASRPSSTSTSRCTRRSRPTIGDHRYDERWPDVTEAGRQARLAFIDRWLGGASSASATRPDRRRGHRSRPGRHGARGRALRRDRAARRDLGRDDVDLPARRRDLHAHRPRLRAARRSARVGGRPARGAARPSSTAPRRRCADPATDGRSARFQTETALEQLPGIAELIGDALGEAERAGARRSGGGCAPAPTRGRRHGRQGRADAISRRYLRDDVLPRSEGEGRLGADLFARKMRHTMRSESLTAERDPGRRGARVRRRSRRDDPARPGARGRAGDAARRSPRTTSRSCAGCSMRSPPSTRRPASCSTSAATRPPGSRRSAASAT